MKQKIKSLLTLLVILVCMTALAACAETQTAYEINDEEGYCVSICFDANGGYFTTNTALIVDSYKLEQLPTDASGTTARIALLSPDDPARGNDAFTPTKSGCFLAGWYASCTTSTDADGNTVCTYADPWDFETSVLEISVDGEYSSQEPVVTLYAAWVPMFEVEFYSLQDGTLLSTYTFDPTTEDALTVPAWDEDSGTINMYRFPSVSGCTFAGAYYDPEGTQPIETDTVAHTGSVDYETGASQDAVMKLYLDYMEGEWYRIYTAKQLVSNASVTGCYEICADLDFTDVIWPTSFVHGNFAGTIQGNGHTISNVSVTQTNNSKVNAGLFGCLTEQAQILDLTIEDVSFTLQAGTRVAGASFGLFAGTISEGAQISGVSVRNGTLYIDSDCYFGVTDYTIGLVCGMGNADALDEAQIDCLSAGTDPDSVHITIDDGQVTVEID